MGRVDGKVALITGGARGMGAAHARMLVAEGAKVVIGDILDEPGEALATELGDAARYVHLDVTDADQWAAAVATATEQFGLLNVLVNNAGITALGKIGEFDMAKWQKCIDVNLTGTFLGMQAVVAPMREAGGGSIINISSIEGLRGAPLLHPVRRVQVRGAWADQVRGHRSGQGQDPGQLGAARLHPYADDQIFPRRHDDRAAGPARAGR